MDLKLTKSVIIKAGIAFSIISILLFGIILLPQLTPKMSAEVPFEFSTYLDYRQSTKFQNEKNVLFFKAGWCSTCSIADKNLTKNVDLIPESLSIYKVDFENAYDMRVKYGVSLQHTYVQVDKDGNELKQWVGSYTIDEILKELV